MLLAIIIVLATAVVILFIKNADDQKKEPSKEPQSVENPKDETSKDPETITTYAVGNAIYYNPQTNETCVYPVSKIGTKTGCMKWYVIDSTSESVKVILDHNTTDTTRWSSTESNETGGDAIKAQLALDTKGWANNLNAHISSDKEIATAVGIKCQTTVENQCIETSLHLDTKLMDVYPTFRKYTWLYDRTGCNESDDCFSLGYWTSTAHPNNDYSAWGIELNGSFQSIHVDNIEEDYEGYFGLRPVIEIPKTNL